MRERLAKIQIQLTYETSTNILRICTCLIPWTTEKLDKSEFWDEKMLDSKSLELHIFVCSIAVDFNSSFVFYLVLMACQNTA